MRSTSFEITVVAIVRVLLVIEKRVRSTSFSITSLGRVQFLLLVIRIECLHEFQLPSPKNSRYQDNYCCNAAVTVMQQQQQQQQQQQWIGYEDGHDASVSKSLCRHEQIRAQCRRSII